MSWRRCVGQARVAEAKSVIAREKEKAKVAGVVDKGVLNEAGGAVVDWTKHVAWADDQLKKLKRKPLACQSAPVATVQECLDEGTPTEVRCRALHILQDAVESSE